jgi:hypothetical protein
MRIRFVKESIHFSAHQAKVHSHWRRSLALIRNKLTRIVEGACFGSKHVRRNVVLLSFWLLFPFSLILTRDWIGLLVIFQVMTGAVRMQNVAAAKALAACSPTSMRSNWAKGEYRAR